MNAIKLAKFVNEELQTNLKESLITKDSFGQYYLFGEYAIIRSKKYYTVSCSDKTLLFSSLKTATAWCVLDHAKKYFDANRVEALDLKLCSIAVDIAVHKNMIRNAQKDSEKIISIIKLQEDNYKRKTILNELEVYINSSKKIQDRNFLKKESKFNYL
jgi:hypothetical protein